MPFGLSAGTAALIGGGVAAGGSVLGGLIGSGASSAASSAEVQASRIAAATQQNMFNQTQQAVSPWYTAGSAGLYGEEQALGLIPGGTGGQGWSSGSGATLPQLLGLAPLPAGQSLTSILQNTPGYQFQFNQGEQAIQNSAAAKGGLIGGNTLTALQNYGQGTADQTYQQYLGNVMSGYFNPMANLAQNGQNAALGVGSLGASAANGIASSTLAGGQAAASGITGGANAMTGAIGGVSNSIGQTISQYQLQQLLSGMPGTAQYNAANTSAYNNASSGVNTFNAGNPFSSVPS